MARCNVTTIDALPIFAYSRYVPGFWFLIHECGSLLVSPLRDTQSASRLINARRFKHAASPRDKDKLSHPVFGVSYTFVSSRYKLIEIRRGAERRYRGTKNLAKVFQRIPREIARFTQKFNGGVRRKTVAHGCAERKRERERESV